MYIYIYVVYTIYILYYIYKSPISDVILVSRSPSLPAVCRSKVCCSNSFEVSEAKEIAVPALAGRVSQTSCCTWRPTVYPWWLVDTQKRTSTFRGIRCNLNPSNPININIYLWMAMIHPVSRKFLECQFFAVQQVYLAALPAYHWDIIWAIKNTPIPSHYTSWLIGFPTMGIYGLS